MRRTRTVMIAMVMIRFVAILGVDCQYIVEAFRTATICTLHQRIGSVVWGNRSGITYLLAIPLNVLMLRSV